MKKIIVTILLMFTSLISFGQFSKSDLKDAFKYDNPVVLVKNISEENKNSCIYIKKNKYTLLAISIKLDKPKIFKTLLKHKVNLEKACESKTPLMYAVKYGRLSMVKRLIEKGAKLNAKTNGGKTALDYAEKYEQEEVYEYLKSL